MARKKPVSVWGIEFDALIDETKTMTSTIPEYPVENGFPVSDTIINDPIQVSMTLYLSNTPVTWLYRHGSSKDRVKRVCETIEQKWFEKKLTKIVTSDTTYTNMGLTSISIKKSTDIGYAREISISAKKVRQTKRKTSKIPKYVLKSGESMANAGKAAASKTSAKSSSGASSSSSSSGGSSSKKGSSSKRGSSSKSGSSASRRGSSGKRAGSGGSSGSNAKKSASVLYGAASGLGLI